MPVKDPQDIRDRVQDLGPEGRERYVRNTAQGRTLLGGGKSPKKPAISGTDFFLMLMVAIFFDVLTAIPFLGILFNIPAVLGFYIWFTIKGVSFTKPKRALSFVGVGIFKLIPILSIIPGWSGYTIKTYADGKSEAILAKVAGVAGGVAGASGALAKVAPGKAGQQLREVSERAKNVQQNAQRNMIQPNKTVGNEINKPKPQNNTEEESAQSRFSKKQMNTERSDQQYNAGLNQKISNEKPTPFKNDLG